MITAAILVGSFVAYVTVALIVGGYEEEKAKQRAKPPNGFDIVMFSILWPASYLFILLVAAWLIPFRFGRRLATSTPAKLPEPRVISENETP